MPKRISLTRLNEDKELFKLFNNNNQEAETNSETRRLAKKAMKKVIEEQLTARQKQVLVLYYFNEIDMPTIAKMLDVNVSTVSRTLKYARNKLLNYLKYYFL
jgi:RNA polymerase sigma-70 factor (ECF subfamily)